MRCVAPRHNDSLEAAAKAQARELGLTHADIEEVIDYVCSVAHRRQVFYLWRPALRDPADDMVLELAVEAACEIIVAVWQVAESDRSGHSRALAAPEMPL